MHETPDQLLIRETVRGLAARYDDDYWLERDEAKEFPWAFYNDFAAGGWLGMCIPEEYGGGGLGIAEAGLLMLEVAASGAAMNGCSALHLTIFGLNVVVKHGSEEMKREVLEPAITGDLHVCFGITEPDAGTDTTSISTFARRDGGRWVIDGKKVWISKAVEADKMVLLTRTRRLVDCERRTDGMTMFLVDMDDPGIEVRPINKLGRNSVGSNEVFLSGVQVEDDRIIGEEGKGFWHLLDGINPERILLSFESVGIGEAALRRAVKYANERNVFGRPIGKNQGIAFPLAEARMRLDAAVEMAWLAAQRYDNGDACGREANTAKFLCADAAFLAADRALQTHGGMGYAREYHVERYFREARLMRIAPVSQEMVLNFISEHVLGLPRSY